MNKDTANRTANARKKKDVKNGNADNARRMKYVKKGNADNTRKKRRNRDVARTTGVRPTTGVANTSTTATRPIAHSARPNHTPEMQNMPKQRQEKPTTTAISTLPADTGTMLKSTCATTRNIAAKPNMPTISGRNTRTKSNTSTHIGM